MLTPNLPEAEALTGIADRRPGRRCTAPPTALLRLGAPAVLLKGGHLPGDEVVDLLATADGDATRSPAPRIDTRHTHGTGCTLASAIATGLAQGMALRERGGAGARYVRHAIATAPGYGAATAPLNHGVTVR